MKHRVLLLRVEGGLKVRKLFGTFGKVPVILWQLAIKYVLEGKLLVSVAPHAL